MTSVVSADSKQRAAGCAAVVAVASAAVAYLALPLCPARAGALSSIAWSCATLSLSWSICAASIVGIGYRFGLVAAPGEGVSQTRSTPADASFLSAAHMSALMFGVTAAIALTVVLLTRLIYVSIDLLNGFPWQATRQYGFDAAGLWSLGLLFTSCAAGLLSTGHRGLFACQLWCSVSIGVWGCLLIPPFRPDKAGIFQPTGSTIMLAGCLALLLMVANWLGVWLDRRRAPRADSAFGPVQLGRDGSWPGFRSSCGIIAAVTMVLVVYHLAVPTRSSDGGFRMGALAISGISAMAAYAALSIAARARSAGFVGAGFGFCTLALGGLATALLPAEPVTLAARYPMVFGALLSGFSLSAAGMIFLWARWRTLATASGASNCYSYLLQPIRRTLFLSLSLALMLASLAACWPRLPAISAMDDSLGRVAGGTAANLLLALTCLRASRVLRGPTFKALWVLALVVTGGFLVVRLLPFTSQYG